MPRQDRWSKARGWLEVPEKHILSIVDDGEMLSVVVVGDHDEYVVCINGEGELCGCPANRLRKIICSHIVFLFMWLGTPAGSKYKAYLPSG